MAVDGAVVVVAGVVDVPVGGVLLGVALVVVVTPVGDSGALGALMRVSGVVEVADVDAAAVHPAARIGLSTATVRIASTRCGPGATEAG